MADKTKGLITLLRDIQNHWLWKKYKPFSGGQAWIDMLLLANHKDNKIPFAGDFIEIKRGQFLSSRYKLAERWGWSLQQIRTFEKYLLTDSMITRQNVTNQATLFTICNYDNLQKLPTHQTTDQQQTSNRPATLNKYVKNVKNDNKESIPPLLEDVITYCKERKNNVDPDKWHNFYSAKGWMIGKNKMKNWKAAVRTWEQKESEQYKAKGEYHAP